MLDWILSQIDTFDIFILVVCAAVTAYFLIGKNSNNERYSPNVVSVQPTASSSKDKPVIDRMKDEKRPVLIMYGSQTGTAEELSGRLSKDFARYSQKAIVLDPELFDTDDFGRLTEIENCLLVLCMATYGEGDPTDNAQGLIEFINNTEVDLTGVSYAVFGLGNKTYEHFNAVGIELDKRLEDLGAKRVFELGLGDDDANLEEDFMRWREGFLPKVADLFNWEVNTNMETMRQYRLELVPKEKVIPTFHGEMGRLNGFEKLRPPFDMKNPFYSTVLTNKELHSELSDRSCRHIEFSTIDGFRYEAGDHLAVFPNNDEKLVDEIVNLLNFDPNQVFRLINVDEDSSKRNPFPCPTTYREALVYYVDICQPIKSHVLKAISEYCTDETEKNNLLLLSTASEEGLKKYNTYVCKERRSIVDILKEHPTCKPPIDYLLELLPRLQARYYSIASSPKADNKIVAVCAVVTKYKIGERQLKGVCTNYLLDKPDGTRVAIYARKSTMRLPHRQNTPVIMIGPGTGYAPFRSFIQERAFHKQNGRETGEMHLYYGCRHPDQDYIYQQEIEEAVSEGVITQLHCAFSRAQDKKVYVQDKLWESKEAVYKIISDGGYIYVCGDARCMARDVQATLLRIFREEGGKTEQEAAALFKDLEKQRRYQADVWS
ncbi:unnamed protein product [Auanema sp. JU1783]|nr:unnamed protein product [Auanema sp. JU1783]